MAEPRPPEITVSEQVTAVARRQVVALVEHAAATDGHAAVNEAGLLALGQAAVLAGSDPATAPEPAGRRPPAHVLAREPGEGELVGYGQVRWENDLPVVALVVAPEHRRRGIGSRLWRTLARLAAVHSHEPPRVWASGDDPAARGLAGQEGLRPVRTLLVLGRPLSGALPPAEPPEGVAIRTFRPGQDDAAWLAVNASAFADHPEQGSLTRSDLDQRMAEPWFDADGFFLAVRESVSAELLGGQVLGFHWTKREPDADVGEVYVIGVDPRAGIHGLGTSLLGVGLAYLRDRGAREVELYVEADNTRGLGLYERFGFSRRRADVMYAATGTGAGPG